MLKTNNKILDDFSLRFRSPPRRSMHIQRCLEPRWSVVRDSNSSGPRGPRVPRRQHSPSATSLHSTHFIEFSRTPPAICVQNTTKQSRGILGVVYCYASGPSSRNDLHEGTSLYLPDFRLSISNYIATIKTSLSNTVCHKFDDK